MDAVWSRIPIRSAAGRTVRECADRDNDQVWLRRFCVEDLRAAVRAEMEDMLLLVRLIGDSRVVAEATGDIHLIR
jgi:hypothetical protein